MTEESVLERIIPDDDRMPVHVDMAHPSLIEGRAQGAVVTCSARIPRPDQAERVFKRIIGCPQVVVYGQGDFRYATMGLLEEEGAVGVSKEGKFYMVKCKVVASHAR